MIFRISASRTRIDERGYSLTSHLPTFEVHAVSEAGARTLAYSILLNGTVQSHVDVDLYAVEV